MVKNFIASCSCVIDPDHEYRGDMNVMRNFMVVALVVALVVGCLLPLKADAGAYLNRL